MGKRGKRRAPRVEDECKLCGETNQLKRSHIIPKFVYKMLGGEDGASSVTVSNGVKEKAHGGETEPMLCDRCEGLLSEWEKPASWLIKRSGWQIIDEDSSLMPPRPKGAWVTFNRFSEIKLFILSYLWRAHISSLESYKHFTLPANMLIDIEKTLKAQVEMFERTKFQWLDDDQRVYDRPALEGILHPECYPIQTFVNSFAVQGRLVDKVTIPPQVQKCKEDNEVLYVEFVMVGVVFRVFIREGYTWLSRNAGTDQRVVDLSIIRPGRSFVYFFNERDHTEIFEEYWSLVKGHVGGV